MENYSIAFFIGLLGSLHCVGMCGPIAFALPLKKSSKLYQVFGAVIYNFGRIITYALLGFIFGFFGQGIKLASSQQFLSIAIGVILIASVFFPLSWLNKLNPNNKIIQLIGSVKQQLGLLLRSSKPFNLLRIGLLNGFLPCGLVYTALGGAIATGNTQEGVWFMVFFGLGTLPLMFLAVQFANFVSLAFRNKIRKIFPFLLVLIGVLFVLRGLNLNIPYLSPKINVERPFVQDCD
ncbi:MAG: hypothetical protein CVT95_10300 [Bacteroidetes bacterium HGW-Bacteroidetes-12]|nr:MAG: hypothetical protein CVT95_10300 [Bacteroidetes bacterium HGW-Bacteroidetes-12]